MRKDFTFPSLKEYIETKSGNVKEESIDNVVQEIIVAKDEITKAASNRDEIISETEHKLDDTVERIKAAPKKTSKASF